MPQSSENVSFKSILTDATPAHLGGIDPVFRLYLRIWPKWSSWIFIVWVIVGLLYLGASVVLVYILFQQGFKYDLNDLLRELFINSGITLFVTPLLWAYYDWQPRAISEVLGSLGENGVIGDPINDTKKAVLPSRHFNRKRNFFVSVFFAALLTSIWYLLVTNEKHWFNDAPPLYLYYSTFVLFLTLYALGWILMRQRQTAKLFDQIFNQFEINSKLLHPDGANGFASLGNYAIRLALLAVFIGFWIVVLTIFPLFFNQQSNFGPATILMVIAYVVMVPVLLLPPVMGAHRVMKSFNENRLFPLALEITTMLQKSEINRVTADKELLHELEHRYQLLERGYKEWPFRTLDIRGFFISAVIPVLGAFIPVIVDRLFAKTP
jgi:hypothetical protein